MIEKDDIVVMRWGNREAMVKVVNIYSWSEKLKKGKRKNRIATVERQDGSTIDVDTSRLLTLSEAQKSPLTPLDAKEDHPPRLRKPGA